MRQKNVGMTVGVITLAIILLACDTPVIDTHLDGTWVSENGSTLTFASGQLTRMIMFGGTETGSYVTDNGNIIFRREDFPDEIMPYSLRYPELTVFPSTTSEVSESYFHDTPGRPSALLEGTWLVSAPRGTGGGGSGGVWGATVVFGPAKPTRESGGAIEGDYIWTGRIKGKYTINGRNIPAHDRLVITPTHIHGQQLYEFLANRLAIQLQVLFNLRELANPPAGLRDEWWITPEEARKYFVEAAAGIPEGERLTREQLMSASRVFYTEHFTIERYRYSLTVYDELALDTQRPMTEREFPFAVIGNDENGDPVRNWLTLVEETPYGNYFYYYYKANFGGTQQ